MRRSSAPASPLLKVKMGGPHGGIYVIGISAFIPTCPARCVAWYVQPTVGSPPDVVADSARASGDGDMGGRPATPTAPAVCIFALSTCCRTADRKSRPKWRHVIRHRWGGLTPGPVRLAKEPLNAQTATAEDCLGHALACCLWTTGCGRRRDTMLLNRMRIFYWDGGSNSPHGIAVFTTRSFQNRHIRGR